MTRYTKRYVAPQNHTLRKGLDGLEIMRLKRQIKDYDWAAFEAAQERLAKNSYQYDEDKMTDLAIVQAGENRLETPGIHTREAMIKAAKVAYGGQGKPEEILLAMALVCWELKLSPNPALGHVWIFPGKGDKGHIVMVGIYGLINLARRDHEFVLRTPREMTAEERADHNLAKDDIGVVYPIIDMRQARPAMELRKAGFDIPIEEITYYGIGIWKPSENTWKTGTGRMVAEKRALANALRKLGLNAGVGLLPDLSRHIQGANYDETQGGYLVPENATVKLDDLDVIEGELAKQLEAENTVLEAAKGANFSEGESKTQESPETPLARFERLKTFLVSEVGKHTDTFDRQKIRPLFVSASEMELFCQDLFGGPAMTDDQKSVLAFWASKPDRAKTSIENWRKTLDPQDLGLSGGGSEDEKPAQAGEETPLPDDKTDELPPLGDPSGANVDVDLGLDEASKALQETGNIAKGLFPDDLGVLFPKAAGQ